jgi:hypothetical protein
MIVHGGYDVREITNSELMLADIPQADADWDVIGEFALTYDGYKAWGSFEKCAEIANARRDGSLADLRTCLFFEQRRWRHFGDDPDRETMSYIRGLVEQIRSRVGRGTSRHTDPGAAPNRKDIS